MDVSESKKMIPAFVCKTPKASCVPGVRWAASEWFPLVIGSQSRSNSLIPLSVISWNFPHDVLLIVHVRVFPFALDCARH